MDVNRRLYNFLKDCGVFFFATADEGRPRVRPFGFVMLFDGRLYFGMGQHKAVYRQLAANPHAEICACKNGDWLRIRGRAVFDLRPEVEAAMFAESPGLMELYPPGGTLVHANCYLEDMEAELVQGGKFEKLL